MFGGWIDIFLGENIYLARDLEMDIVIDNLQYDYYSIICFLSVFFFLFLS